jgi:hypothetical protein
MKLSHCQKWAIAEKYQEILDADDLLQHERSVIAANLQVGVPLCLLPRQEPLQIPIESLLTL